MGSMNMVSMVKHSVTLNFGFVLALPARIYRLFKFTNKSCISLALVFRNKQTLPAWIFSPADITTMSIIRQIDHGEIQIRDSCSKY